MILSKSALIQLAVTSVIAVLLGFSGVSTYHVRSFDRAFMAWYHNPTPENERALEREQRNLHDQRLAASMKIGVVTFSLGNCVWSLLRRKTFILALASFALCSTLVAFAGLPSFPLDRKSWFVDFIFTQVSAGPIQLFFLTLWFLSLLGALIMLLRARKNVQSASSR